MGRVHRLRRLVSCVNLRILLAGLLIGGCGIVPPEPRVEIQRVEVPVAQPIYCDAAIPPRPALAIAALKPDSSAADNQRAMLETVAALKGGYVALEDELRGCAKPEAVK